MPHRNSALPEHEGTEIARLRHASAMSSARTIAWVYFNPSFGKITWRNSLAISRWPALLG